jgi:hypothetical protein
VCSFLWLISRLKGWIRRVALWAGRLVFLWVVLGAVPAAASTWTVVPTVDPAGAISSQLNGVWCAKSGLCVAVGQYTSSPRVTVTLAEGWAAGRWTVIPTPNAPGATSSQLNAVSCLSATECIAVGSYRRSAGITKTLVERFHGGVWTIEPSPNISATAASELTSVSCTSVRVCVAVGGSPLGATSPTVGTLVERRIAGEWRSQRAPRVGELSGVSCTSPLFCMAVGGSAALRWDGRTWTRLALAPVPINGPGFFYGVACNSPSACEAVGLVAPSPSSHGPEAQRWNGRRWADQPGASPRALSGFLLSV